MNKQPYHKQSECTRAHLAAMISSFTTPSPSPSPVSSLHCDLHHKTICSTKRGNKTYLERYGDCFPWPNSTSFVNTFIEVYNFNETDGILGSSVQTSKSTPSLPQM